MSSLPTSHQARLPSLTEQATAMRPVDAGHPSLLQPFRTATLPVRHTVSMEEIEDEDAVQYVGESLHGGSHLLERNDEPGDLLCSTSDGPSLSTPLDNPRGVFKIVVPDFLL
ncbi:hypothetical protein PILCRDRAFT_1315 [Piloderma croceum F 1598]|uniref:Uncharacterized protein n=1 Tax=Piloderma croceum (strain F 1598) TaxID=765440 RepID=A0A0C3CN76_PILCF|nr:hypothetical protein PILCRDRAFT_1315 [Piloderma croceum F 1598]